VKGDSNAMPVSVKAEDEMTIGTGSNSVHLVKKMVDGIPLFVEPNFQAIEIAPATTNPWWPFKRKRLSTPE
jgi:hypothetical protein